MITLALAALSFLAPQDPDRSTPEKACENFSKFWENLSADSNMFIDLQEELDKLGDFCSTEDKKARSKKKLDEFRKMNEANRSKNVGMAIKKKAEGKDGSVTLDLEQTVQRTRQNPETDKTETVEEKLPQRMVFEKNGANWLVREIHRACWSCSGTGKCGTCKGTGEFSGDKCSGCQGNKTCEACKGEALTKEKLSDVGGLDLLFAEGEPKFSTDLSSPKAAAQTVLDLERRRGLAGTRKYMEVINKIFASVRLYFAPSIVKEIEDAMAKAVEEGKKRFKEEAPRIESVEEKGDTAYVILVTTASRGGEKKESRERKVLKKVGDKWLVDAEQYPCWSCEGKGACGSCKGTGKMGEEKCFGCDGEKSCRTCKGGGWHGE